MGRKRRSGSNITLRKLSSCSVRAVSIGLTRNYSYVKGLPIKVKVDEVNEHGDAVSREILSSFQDAYTCELEEMYECLTSGKPIKSGAEDALNDLRLYDMMYKKYDQDLTNG